VAAHIVSRVNISSLPRMLTRCAAIERNRWSRRRRAGDVSEFFHVAPMDQLSPGLKLAGRRPPNLTREHYQVLDSLFPSGRLTPWGEAMLTADPAALLLGPEILIAEGLARAVTSDRLDVSEAGRIAMGDSRNRVVELVFELVRRLAFPDKPSRMSAVFAYRTLDEARAYRADRRDPANHEIWRVACDASTPLHLGDGRWLGVPRDALLFVAAARHYWFGRVHPFPVVSFDTEVLIPAGALTVVAREERAQTN